MAKLTKKQRAAIDAAQEAELAAFEAVYAKYNGKEFDGHFRWFDGASGEGMVTLSDGTLIYCHFSSIAGIDKNGYAYPTLQDQRTLDRFGREKVAVRVVPIVFTLTNVMCQTVQVLGD
jgi:hypothetical protein